MTDKERAKLDEANKRLEMLRKYIDATDEQIAKHIAERFDLVREIAVIKADVNLPIYSAGREAQILNHLIISRYHSRIAEIFKTMLIQSRLEMYELMDQLSSDE